MKRCFIAFKIPAVIKDSLQSDYLYWRDMYLFGLPIKWVDQVNWHVTLVFLGNIENNQVDVLVDLVSKVRVGAEIDCELRGLGYFGEGRNIRILYVNLWSNILNKYVSILRENLREAGYNFDNKKFSGHMTIGRIKRSLQDAQVNLINNLAGEYGEKSWGKWNAGEVILYESDMREYKVIKKFNIVNG